MNQVEPNVHYEVHPPRDNASKDVVGYVVVHFYDMYHMMARHGIDLGRTDASIEVRQNDRNDLYISAVHGHFVYREYIKLHESDILSYMLAQCEVVPV